MRTKLLAFATAVAATAMVACPAAAQDYYTGYYYGPGPLGWGVNTALGAAAAVTSPLWAPAYPGYYSGYYPGYAPSYGYGTYGPGYGYATGYYAPENDAAYGYAPRYGNSDYGYVPGPRAGVETAGRDESYCARRFRSYNPATGTYLGFDGVRHPCQ